VGNTCRRIMKQRGALGSLHPRRFADGLTIYSSVVILIVTVHSFLRNDY
jgi:hypothetical protein